MGSIFMAKSKYSKDEKIAILQLYHEEKFQGLSPRTLTL